MRSTGTKPVSRFKIEFEVANSIDVGMADRGALDPAKVRHMTIQGVVDSGASRLVLPPSVAKHLGLIPSGKIRVRSADRRSGTRDVVKGVYVRILGRDGTFTAAIEPKRRTALVGAIVLEDLDFLLDSGRERLVPRDKRMVVSEIE